MNSLHVRTRLVTLGLIFILLAEFFVFPTRALAAPPALNCNTNNAAISSPESGAVVSGVVQIEGSASLGGAFQYYKVEFSTANRDDYVVFSGLVRQQVVNGQLAVWDSASVPDGQYSIRLRVVDQTGNYCEVVVRNLRVQNSAPIPPTDTPTPEESPTPTEVEGTPAFSVVPTVVPTIQLPTSGENSGAPAPTVAQPGVTRTPSSGTSLLGGINATSIVDALTGIFSGLFRTFLFGAMAMAGVIVVIGVIFYVRRMM